MTVTTSTTPQPNDDEHGLRGIFTVRQEPPPVPEPERASAPVRAPVPEALPEPAPFPEPTPAPVQVPLPVLTPAPAPVPGPEQALVAVPVPVPASGPERAVVPVTEPGPGAEADAGESGPAPADSAPGVPRGARDPERTSAPSTPDASRAPDAPQGTTPVRGSGAVQDLAPGRRAGVDDAPEPVHCRGGADGFDDTVGFDAVQAAQAREPVRGGASRESAAPGDSVRPAPPGYPGARARWSPLIVGESTHEIPVHLLFRDEAEAPRPTVVGRRLGTGEQPRIRRAPVPAPAPVLPSRAAPSGDPRLTERPGPALSGSAAVLVGLAALLGCAAVGWWAGALPAGLAEAVRLPVRPYLGIGAVEWALLALGVTVALFAFGGLGRGRVGQAWVLTLFGDYRGSVRRTGLLWMSPLLLRRGVDVRLRHWRSEPMPAVDANGTELRVVVLVVWRVRDTVRAALGVEDHEGYLREQVEAAMARVLSQLPADAFHDEAPTLRNAEAVGDALTRMLSAECRPVGVEVFSAQPTRIEYAPEIAAAMQRSRIAAIDARHRDSVLTSVVDAVDDTVHRLTSRGLVELDDYERKALVKDLTVAFYTGRQGNGAP
ncbi:SPFH domain-containing protein [Streptomyces sp. NPDC093085]|uniref:SPFH domain-containing protein n=1 Tax=Streptomyces sp. NPDC093085 TaxID=3155068 RepID=UPI0034463EEE